ncbi:BLOC-1-related complex subunit 8 isoform X2 [Hippopotamus amphibius kiboko]|uniref:BLOC-1-related complex subunit 8 isoform X2 n=1 Tax=Hippopotamus amphibius kiboko TaxID=575201 RepID=UPI0025948FCB|nr:BLOC-1-related complex subunit 8 isoform X2 [Hippopotamus amphibius kiboko]
MRGVKPRSSGLLMRVEMEDTSKVKGHKDRSPILGLTFHHSCIPEAGVQVTDKFTESVYVLANEPSVALYRLQEHVRRSLPELAQHKADMQRWEEQSQGAIYTVEYACSAVKNLVDSSVYFRSVEGLLKQAISIRDHMNATAQGHSPEEPPPPSSA